MDGERLETDDRDVYDQMATLGREAGLMTGDRLTDGQRAQLLDLTTKYKNVFTDRLGHTDITEHRIVVRDETPCYQPSYSIPEALRDQVQHELAEMERSGVIEYDLLATWNSPMVTVRKSGGGIRICNNFI